MFLTDSLVIWLAIFGGAAWILGFRKLGLSMMWPMCFRFVVFPLIWEFVPWPLLVIVAPFAAFAAVLIGCHKFNALLFGDRAASHATGIYLTRGYDAFGRGVRWIFQQAFFWAR